jgi:hypothetical protein
LDLLPAFEEYSYFFQISSKIFSKDLLMGVAAVIQFLAEMEKMSSFPFQSIKKSTYVVVIAKGTFFQMDDTAIHYII